MTKRKPSPPSGKAKKKPIRIPTMVEASIAAAERMGVGGDTGDPPLYFDSIYSQLMPRWDRMPARLVAGRGGVLITIGAEPKPKRPARRKRT